MRKLVVLRVFQNYCDILRRGTAFGCNKTDRMKVGVVRVEELDKAVFGGRLLLGYIV